MMSKFRIVPKRDFGPHSFLIDGKKVRRGFVVTDGVCNVMPGATWFLTIPDAMRAIRVLVETGGDAALFWRTLRA